MAEAFGAPLFNEQQPLKFTEAVKGIGSAFGTVGGQISAVLGGLNSQIDSVTAKLRNLSQSSAVGSMGGSNWSGTSTWGMSNPANTILSGSGVGGSTSSTIGGNYRFTYHPFQQPVPGQGSGGGGGGTPGQTQPFGGSNGGNFSWGRFAVGAGLAAAGGVVRAGLQGAASAVDTGTTWRQAEALFQNQTGQPLSTGSLNAAGRQLKGITGYTSPGQLAAAMQNLQSISGVANGSNQWFGWMNQAGAEAQVSRAFGTNYSLGDATAAQASVSNTSQGRMWSQMLGLNAQQANPLSLATAVMNRMGGFAAMHGAGQSRISNQINQMGSQLGFAPGYAATMMQVLQAEAGYNKRTGKTIDLGAINQNLSPQQQAAQFQSQLKTLGIANQDAVKQATAAGLKAGALQTLTQNASDTSSSAGLVMARAASAFSSSVDSFTSSVGKLVGAANAMGGGGGAAGQLGGDLLQGLITSRLLGGAGGGLGGVLGRGTVGSAGRVAGKVAEAGTAAEEGAVGGGLLGILRGGITTLGRGSFLRGGLALGGITLGTSLLAHSLMSKRQGFSALLGSATGGAALGAGIGSMVGPEGALIGGAIGGVAGLGIDAVRQLAPRTLHDIGHWSRDVTNLWGLLGKNQAGNAGGKTSPASAPLGSSGGVVADAQKYLGVPYKWGGTNPATGLDCSGFVQRTYADVGISLPRTSQQQVKVGSPVPNVQSAQPGDLVFYAGSDGTNSSPGHVGIYVGGGRMIDAPHTGAVVRYDGVGNPTAIRRVVGTVGQAAGAANTSTNATTASSGITTSLWSGGALSEGNSGNSESSALLSALSSAISGSFGAATGQTSGVNGAAAPLSNGASGALPSGNLAQWIASAEKIAGVGADWTSGLNTIITHESGGNPAATNNWDSNAKAGHPSQGLMQLIPSTFASNAIAPYNKNILDPTSNIAAGIRYIENRYHGINNVPGVKAVAAGGKYVGYERGTEYVDRDQMAMLHRGETVLRSSQGSTARMLAASAGGGSGGASIVIQKGAIHIERMVADDPKSIDDLAEKIMAAIQRRSDLRRMAAS